jgi:long-chain acyl-CoA synthetase
VFVKAGHELTAQQLRDHVAIRLASFKVPTYVVFFEQALPRNASGKILKRELQRQIAEVTA